jgi:hypothetical protein
VPAIRGPLILNPDWATRIDVAIFGAMKQELTARHHNWRIQRTIPDFPREAIVPLDASEDVIFLASRIAGRDAAQPRIAEVAFAHELAARNRPFGATADPSVVFDKSVAWFLPRGMISPALWNYSRQVCEFAKGLEGQGNRLFCSSDEVRYWENKAYMHERFAQLEIPTPKTKLLSRETWRSVAFDIEPVLIKEEHSAGSAGIHQFETAEEARRFVASYPFRPSESLIMQEVVPGATKDLRLTMVGNRMIRRATFWRVKTQQSQPAERWTTTASKYGSLIQHDAIPDAIVPVIARYLQMLNIRLAGIDLMWVDDDVSRDPLVLELSPYFQPNPQKPEEYDHLTYKQYKERPYARGGYFQEQYRVFREISAEILNQGFV